MRFSKSAWTAPKCRLVIQAQSPFQIFRISIKVRSITTAVILSEDWRILRQTESKDLRLFSNELWIHHTTGAHYEEDHDEETIRIISARRAAKREKEAYYRQFDPGSHSR